MQQTASEFEIVRYDLSLLRQLDPAWRAELGSDCIDADPEPPAADCCQVMSQCNATSVQIGGFTGTASEFCSAVVWAGGRNIQCGADGSATLLSNGVATAAAVSVIATVVLPLLSAWGAFLAR